MVNSPNLSSADSTQMSVSMCIQWSFWSVQSPFWLEYNVWLWTGYYFEPGKCLDKATKNNLGYTFWQCCCLKKGRQPRALRWTIPFEISFGKINIVLSIKGFFFVLHSKVKNNELSIATSLRHGKKWYLSFIHVEQCYLLIARRWWKFWVSW